MTDPTTSTNEFQDPLDDFEPRHYDDPLEQALAEEAIGTIRHEPYTTITPDTPVHKAIEKLAGLHIACILVVDKNQLVGVLSDRDVLMNVAFEYDEVKDKPVSEVMTRDPIYVYESDSAVNALSVMAMCGYRHVPVVDLNANPIGIISPQRVQEFLQKHYTKN